MEALCADTHCHLDDPTFETDLDAVVARAKAAGIDPLIAPAESFSSSRKILEIAARYPSVLPCVGVHPHQAGKMEPGHRAGCEALAARPEVVGIGEIGLDYYYEHSDRPTQIDVCGFFLDLAARLGKPACLHVRDKDGADLAVSDLISMIKPHAGRITGVIHCFTGSFDAARRFLDLGFYLSFTGILTFKKAENVREVFRRVPADRILLETDSPYLAPPPRRGRRNEPAYLSEVFRQAAALRGMKESQWSEQLRTSERRLFPIRCGLPGSVLNH